MDRWVWAEDPGKRRTQRRGQRGHLGLQGPVPAAGARLSPRAGMKAVTVGSRGRSQGHGQQVSREQSRQGGPGSCVPRAGSTGTEPKAPQAAGGLTGARGLRAGAGARGWELGASAAEPATRGSQGPDRLQGWSRREEGELRRVRSPSGRGPGGTEALPGGRYPERVGTQGSGNKGQPWERKEARSGARQAEGSGAGSGVEMLRPRSPRERGR